MSDPLRLRIGVLVDESVEVEVVLRPGGGLQRVAVQPQGGFELEAWRAEREAAMSAVAWELHLMDPQSDPQRFEQLSAELEQAQRDYFAELGAPTVNESPSIGARLMRSLPWSEIEAVARAEIARSRGGIGALVSDPRREREGRWARLLADKEPRRSVGRPSMSDAELANFAHRYVELCALGKGARATLAQEAHITEAAAGDRLTRARAAGLLTAPPRGRQGGELTAKALALLDGDDDA